MTISNPHSILVSSAWFTVAVWVYFRGIATSDRNFDVGRRFGFNPPPAAIEHLAKIGPVSFWSFRVIIPTIAVAIPCWLAPIGLGTPWHDALILTGIGTFLSPLSLPSEATPSSEDATHIATFSLKWFVAKIDAAIKVAFAIGLLALVCLLPGISWAANHFSEWIFPVVQGRPASAFIAQIIEGGAAVLLIMYLVRLSQVTLYGIPSALIFALCLGYSWIQMQWFVNEVFVVSGSPLLLLGQSVTYTLFLSLITDFFIARVELRFAHA